MSESNDGRGWGGRRARAGRPPIADAERKVRLVLYIPKWLRDFYDGRGGMERARETLAERAARDLVSHPEEERLPPGTSAFFVFLAGEPVTVLGPYRSYAEIPADLRERHRASRARVARMTAKDAAAWGSLLAENWGFSLPEEVCS